MRSTATAQYARLRALQPARRRASRSRTARHRIDREPGADPHGSGRWHLRHDCDWLTRVRRCANATAKKNCWF